MLIDSHLHLSRNYYDDINHVVESAKQNGVEYLIVSCCSMSEIYEGLELLNEYNNVFLTIGLHPSEVENYSDFDIEKIKEIATKYDRVIAIGEIGLDYYYGKDNIEMQKELFIKQLQLAYKLKLPVVIHTREATEDTINILKEYNLKGVIHCFSASLEVANIYIKMGYKIGVGGVSTFKNSKLKETLKNIDLSNIILETDSPYLSPEPVRGTKNEPSNVVYVAENLSLIKNIDLHFIEDITFKNTVEVFDLNKFL